MADTAEPIVGPIKAKTFSESELRAFIATLARARGKKQGENGEASAGGRFAKLHGLIEDRDAHFYNQPDADPKLPPPHEDVDGYQTDALRRAWVALKARLVENAFQVNVHPPRDLARLNRKAAELKAVMTQGLELVQERRGFRILDDLADGQIIHGVVGLHWRKAVEVWPQMPDALELESLEDLDEEEKGDYEPGDDGTFRQTPEAQMRADDERKARAGFPWYVEVIRGDMLSWIEDRSVLNGLGGVLVLRNVPLIEYSKRLRESDQLYLSLNEADGKVLIFQEQEGTTEDDPSHSDALRYERTVQVAEWWTRDEYYELVAADHDFTLVKSFGHPYEMPPFAIVTADETNHPDPALAYQPALAGIYRIKPFYDRDVTLGRAIAEQIALPYWWIELADGSYLLDDDGKPMTLTRNTFRAKTLPPGAKLVKAEFDLNPAFVSFLELTGKEMADAKPETGNVDVGASTAPWTIRLAQIQANAPVKKYKAKAARGIRTMVRSMASVMSKSAEEGGFGRPVPVYAQIEADGKMNEETLIAVDPADIVSLDIDIDIDPQSDAQTIANIEHMRLWADDEQLPFDGLDWLTDGLRDQNPQGRWEAWRARQVYQTEIEPTIVKQELARKFGAYFVVTPGLGFAGVNGQAATPEQVLQANGYSVGGMGGAGAPPTGGGRPPIPNSVTQESRATMPSMPDLVGQAAPTGPGGLPG